MRSRAVRSKVVYPQRQPSSQQLYGMPCQQSGSGNTRANWSFLNRQTEKPPMWNEAGSWGRVIKPSASRLAGFTGGVDTDMLAPRLNVRLRRRDAMHPYTCECDTDPEPSPSHLYCGGDGSGGGNRRHSPHSPLRLFRQVVDAATVTIGRSRSSVSPLGSTLGSGSMTRDGVRSSGGEMLHFMIRKEVLEV